MKKKTKKVNKKGKKAIRKQPKKSGHAKVAERQEFVRFMALPRFFRNRDFGFENLGDFAKKFKLHPATLTDWQKDEKFWDEVKKLWKKWGKGRTPDVILGLYRTAVRDGKASEAIAWMKIIEDWKEKGEMKHTGTISLIELLEKADEDDNRK